MIRKEILSTILLVLLNTIYSTAEIIIIPSDYITIQSGINAAENGDTIIVEPGFWTANPLIEGKDLTLASRYLLTGDTSMISQTIIDGSNILAPVLSIIGGNGGSSSIIGFTISGGNTDESRPFPQLGGGIVCEDAQVNITHNWIKSNSNSLFNDAYGGGIVLRNSLGEIAFNTIERQACFFVRITGGVVALRSDVNIHHNVIREQEGGYVFFAGGGIVIDSSEAVISYNLITENLWFDGPGGGITLNESNADIFNNTLFDNVSGIRMMSNNSADIRNNIIFRSLTEEELPESGTNNTLEVAYNAIEGGWIGTGNFNMWPEFVNSMSGDFHLLESSPCIDNGDPSFPNDPDGSRVDIGAFFFQQGPLNGILDPGPMLSLNIYPNPAGEYVLVNIPNEISSGILYLTDLRGRVLRQIRIQGDDIISIDLNTIQSGQYMISFFQSQSSNGYCSSLIVIP